MSMETTIFDMAQWLLVMMSLWWCLGVVCWAAALRLDREWVSWTAHRFAPPGCRRVANGVMAIGLLAVPACSAPQSDEPALTWIGPAESSTSTTTQTIASTAAPTTSAVPSTAVIPTTGPEPTTPSSTAPTSAPATTAPSVTAPPNSNDSPTPLPVDGVSPGTAHPQTPPITGEHTVVPEHTVVEHTVVEHTVVSGEHLWSIAAAQLIAGADQPIDNATIARYWRRLIDENLALLRSGNADLVYPGEVLRLPAVESNR